MEANENDEPRPIGWYKKQGIGRFKRFGCVVIALLLGLYLLVMLLRSALPEG